jgi:hypothetical protein
METILIYPAPCRLSYNSNFDNLAKVNSNRYEAKNHKKLLSDRLLNAGMNSILVQGL